MRLDELEWKTEGGWRHAVVPNPSPGVKHLSIWHDGESGLYTMYVHTPNWPAVTPTGLPISQHRDLEPIALQCLLYHYCQPVTSEGNNG